LLGGATFRFLHVCRGRNLFRTLILELLNLLLCDNLGDHIDDGLIHSCFILTHFDLSMLGIWLILCKPEISQYFCNMLSQLVVNVPLQSFDLFYALYAVGIEGVRSRRIAAQLDIFDKNEQILIYLEGLGELFASNFELDGTSRVDCNVFILHDFDVFKCCRWRRGFGLE